MEPAIAARLSDDILQETAARYGVDAATLRLLDGFESFIYEFTRDDGEYILRLGHSGRRSPALIHGEVDWINYLARGGAGVARAVESACGNLVEQIADGHGDQFLATAFCKAAGRPPHVVGWTPALYETYGRLVGRMHALTCDYGLPDPAWRRPAWDDAVMQTALEQLASDEEPAAAAYVAAFDHVARLPKPADAYGLIHYDAHGGNFFVDDAGRITLFDFDDCCYNWFAYDIAMVLFYMMTTPDVVAQTRAFLPSFLTGYRAEYRLDPAWLAELPHFLKLREIDLYAAILYAFGERAYDDPWCARYLAGRKERIDAGVPYIDIDFMEFAPLLA